MCTYLLRQCRENRYVELMTLLSPTSIQPAGAIKISPSQVKESLRKNERIVSSWNNLKDLGLLSEGLLSVGLTSKFLSGEGFLFCEDAASRDILDTLYKQFFPLTLKSLQDLERNTCIKIYIVTVSIIWWVLNKIFFLSNYMLKCDRSTGLRNSLVLTTCPYYGNASRLNNL